MRRSVPGARAGGRLALAAAVAAACAAGCDETHLLDLGIVLPRGESRLPADVTHVRLRLSQPARELTTEVRDDGGFDLALEIDATSVTGRIALEALTAAGEVRWRGATPPLPLDGIDDRFEIFLSPPGAIAELPAALSPARTLVGAAPLPYGAFLAGGAADGDVPSATVVIYNAYTHDFQLGVDLPEARSAPAVLARTDGRVLIVGGRDATGEARGQVWLYNTNTPPAGSVLHLGDDPRLRRTRAQLTPLGDGRVLLIGGGKPAVIIDAEPTGLVLTSVDDDSGVLERAESATLRTDGSVLVAGGDSAALFDPASGTLSAQVMPSHPQHTAIRTSDGTVWLIGGTELQGETAVPTETAYGLSVDGTVRLATVSPRQSPCLTLVGDALFVGGGTAEPPADAVLLDAATLDPLGAALDPAARGAACITLPNTSVLLVGGVDAAQVPAVTLRLWQ